MAAAIHLSQQSNFLQLKESSNPHGTSLLPIFMYFLTVERVIY